MGAYEQREQAFAHLAAVSSEEFAKKCWMIVRSDAHVYGIECEVFRMNMAKQLFLAGISEADILEALESKTEQILMMCKGGSV